MDDSPPHAPDDDHDDHDDLAALDFSAPDAGSAASGLDVFDALEPGYADGDGEPPTPLFTVTNPPGTVTVTTFMDGRVNHVELSPKVTTMSETDLADEIVVMARLATQDARSAQYSFMLEGMRQQGHDDAATRDFLSRDLDLPSPEEAAAARAEVFAARYASNHD